MQVIEPWCKLLKVREIVLTLRQNANSFAWDVSPAYGNNCRSQMRFRSNKCHPGLRKENSELAACSNLRTFLYVHYSQ